jgi:hypothetical protein
MNFDDLQIGARFCKWTVAGLCKSIAAPTTIATKTTKTKNNRAKYIPDDQKNVFDFDPFIIFFMSKCYDPSGRVPMVGIGNGR